MLNISLQLFLSVATLGFSALAAGVAVQSAGQRFRSAWGLAALGFGLSGASMLVQNGWGAWAVLEGPEAAVWRRYLRWAPAMNHGRLVLLLALNGLLLLLRPGMPPRSRAGWVRAAVVLCAAWLVGAVLGGWEGGYDAGGRHPMMMSASNAFWVLTSFAVLWVALRRNTLDWPLWLALALYALVSSIDVVLLVGMSLGESLWSWSPSTLQRNCVRLVHTLGMVGLALWAYGRVRRGVGTVGVDDAPRWTHDLASG